MTFSLLRNKKLLADSLALIAGVSLTFAFAPFNLFPLAIVAMAVLLTTWLNVSTKQACWRGFLFGMGLFGSGVYWVYISIHTFGETPVWLALLITFLFVGILAIFPALCGYFLSRYFPKTNKTYILGAFPAIWVFAEWVRSWIFSGFPWLLLGNSQTHSFLKGFAPILSVYGVSLAVLLCSSLLVYAVIEFKKSSYKNAFASLLGFILIWAAGYVLTCISWTKPDGKPVQVSLIQGNIKQSLKWSPEAVQPTLDIYKKLTEQHWDSELIIWPESAIPVPFTSAMDFLLSLDTEAKKHHTAVITGVPMQIPNTHDYLNAVMTFGEGRGIYTKHRLVPFGEYVPFNQFFGKLLTFMDIPMSTFVPGKEAAVPIRVKHLKIATFICYEIAYPEQVLATTDNTANMLLTVSNDAWFDGSIAQAQHLQIAQIRALETGRPVLFVSNSGITAIINSHGNIQSALPAYKEDVLTDLVQPMRGKTPLQKSLLDPLFAMLLGLLFWAIRCKKQ